MGTTLLTGQRIISRWIVPLVIIAPVVAIFAPVLFSDRSFAFRDGAHFYHPLFQWITQEWGQGRIPLWNPLENCGTPVLADATSSIFYPGKLIFILPLPFAWLYKLYIIGHVLLAAAGMYALARRLETSAPSAALAAIAYACGGNVVFQYCNVVFLVGAAWLPAALLAIEVIVRCRCWRAMLFFAFILAMMILGGDPQMAYHALLAAGLRLVCAWLSAPTGRDSPAPPASIPILIPNKYEAEIRGLAYPALLYAGAAILAFALAAIQILPSSEAAKSSERVAYNRPRNIFEAAAVALKSTAGDSILEETPGEKITAGLFGQPEPTTHHDRAYNFSISPWRLMEFVWPNISGRAFPTNRSWIGQFPGEMKPWTPTMYLGLLPLLAGVGALRFIRVDGTTRWLSWLVLVFALGSFGWYGLGWMIREAYASLLRGDPSQISIGSPVGGGYWLMVTFLPTYVYFRYPAKLMVVAVAALCAAGAPVVDRLLTGPAPNWVKGLQRLAAISAVLAVVVWCASPYLLTLRVKSDRIFGPFDTRGALFDVITAFLHAAVVAWLLQLMLRRLWDSTEQSNPSATRWKWAIVSCTACELAIANAWLVIAAPSTLWAQPGTLALAIQGDAGQAEPNASSQPRFFRGSYHRWRPESFGQSRSSQRPQELAYWERDTLFPKYHFVARLPLVESYGSLKSLDYESLLLQARLLSSTEVDGSRVPLAEVLRLTSCEYLALPATANIGYANPVAPPAGTTFAENISLWKMKRTLPRTWIVPQIVLLPPIADPLNITAVDERAKQVVTHQRDGKLAVRDFRHVAVVETSDPLNPELLAVNQLEMRTTATIVGDQPQHVTIRAQLDRPGFLVLADRFAPGWTARYEPSPDSRASPSGSMRVTIHRTNRCFRGVELPAGDWLVHFEYCPQSFYRGTTISVIAWLGFVATIGVTVVLAKRQPNNVPLG
jgi:hypothetical protein